METLGEFSCGDCSMLFRSLRLLEKHKAFFCIGSSIGDPVALRQGQPERRVNPNPNLYPGRDGGKGVYPKQARTPDLIRLRGQRGMQVGASDAGPKAGREDLLCSMAESLALRNLTEEFQKLRMSIEESLPNISKLPTETEMLADQVSGRQRGHKEKVREITEQHGRQLAHIQAQNQRLEQQREEIARQLAALTAMGSNAHLETLVLELREQEERNEEALQQLRDQVTSLQAPRGVKEFCASRDSHSPNMHEERKGHHVTFDLISSVDGPLSTQIRALRLAYMQSGGSDPAVLAQMHDLQAEAHTLEQAQPASQAKHRRKRLKPPQQAQKWEVLAVEQENQRLEEEIFRIQRAKEKHRGEEAMGTELQHIQREHIHHTASIQAEIESLRRDVERARDAPRDRRPPPPPPFPLPSQPAMHPLAQMHARPALTHPRPHSSLLGSHVLDPLDSLGPAPYDPAAGFVIFYDLVLGVEATLRVLRLVSALHSGGHEVGRPTPLPAVQCQPGGNLPYTHPAPPGNYATLSVKQPVPRTQPSPSLSLVVEVQAAGGLDSYGQEIQRLVSRGWAQLELFDPHNQVLSGRWRVPVRCLPVRPSLSPGQLNSVPQVGNMELCLRVVNARDGDVQTLAKTDPSNTSQYKYPSMMSTHHAMLQANPPPPLSTLQPSAEKQFPSLLTYNDHQDPPPMEESSQSAIDPSLLKKGQEKEGKHRLEIIVDRVRGAPEGEGSLRLTGYSQRTGKVLMFGDSGLHCCTSSARSSIEYGSLIFGEQQIALDGLVPQEEMILLLRFYHRPVGGSVSFSGLVRQRETPPWEQEDLAGHLAERVELLSAWAVVRLAHSPTQTLRQTTDRTMISWNTGTHSVPLYQAPVPPAMALTHLPEDCLGKPFEPYGAAMVRLHISNGEAPLFPFPPESHLPSNNNTEHCFKVCVEGALNLPWSAFTLGLCSLSPPGAFYHGPRWVTYDHPAPILNLDLSSSQSAPRWRDGFKSFHGRVAHRHLTAIIHLHSVCVNTLQHPLDHHDTQSGEEQRESPSFRLGAQCWAAAPVFTEGNCKAYRHQLPLYQGSPTQAVLNTLANGNCRSVLQDLQQNGQLQFLPGASVFVQVAEGLGEQEPAQSDIKDTDTSQLPVDQLISYSPQPTPPPQLIPTPTTPVPDETFTSQLSSRYLQLVYHTLGPPSHFRASLQPMGPSTPQNPGYTHQPFLQ